MRVRLYPKNADTYLIQFDSVVTVITEKTLFFVLENQSCSDEEGWITINDQNVLSLPNDVRIIVPDKSRFIPALKQTQRQVDDSGKPAAFDIESNCSAK